LVTWLWHYDFVESFIRITKIKLKFWVFKGKKILFKIRNLVLQNDQKLNLRKTSLKLFFFLAGSFLLVFSWHSFFVRKLKMFNFLTFFSFTLLSKSLCSGTRILKNKPTFRPYSHTTFLHTILRYCDKKIKRYCDIKVFFNKKKFLLCEFKILLMSIDSRVWIENHNSYFEMSLQYFEEKIIFLSQYLFF